MIRRTAAAATLLAAIVVLTALPAAAHVTISGTGTQGGYGTFSFKVPNEEDAASTTKLEVQFPTDHPLASVSVEPVPGWTATVQTTKLATPIKTDDGDVTEAVSTITWTGGEIKPGEFQQFPVSAGPLPNVDSLEFKAIQTYSNGDVVRWIDETPASGEEPEHPAPTLQLVAATSGDAHASTTGSAKKLTVSDLPSTVATSSDVDSARTIGIIGLVVGAVGLVVALIALLRKPRSAA
jgi:uncharacterized protein